MKETLAWGCWWAGESSGHVPLREAGSGLCLWCFRNTSSLTEGMSSSILRRGSLWCGFQQLSRLPGSALRLSFPPWDEALGLEFFGIRVWQPVLSFCAFALLYLQLIGKSASGFGFIPIRAGIIVRSGSSRAVRAGGAAPCGPLPQIPGDWRGSGEDQAAAPIEAVCSMWFPEPAQ